MSGGRSEPPTSRRLAEARRRGEVPQSRELTGAAALAGGLAGLAISAPAAARDLARALRGALEAPSSGDPAAALRDALSLLLRLAAPPSLAAAAVALAGGLLAAGFNFAPGALAPRLERVDPLRGLRRLLAPAHLATVALGAVKGALLLGMAAWWLRGAAPLLAALPRGGAEAPWRALPLLGDLAVRLAAVLLVGGALDQLLGRARHRRALRMTPDEVRRERREDEGDPVHRSERRRLHRDLLSAGALSRATVVVVNPSHVAVALRHDRSSSEAPRVVAKGTGAAALRIRSAARRAGIPVVRDVALARALHRLAEVGEEIPEELYEAAAAILIHLHREGPGE